MKFAELIGSAIDDLKGRRFDLAISFAKDPKDKKQIGELADLHQAIEALEAVKTEHKGFD